MAATRKPGKPAETSHATGRLRPAFRNHLQAAAFLLLLAAALAAPVLLARIHPRPRQYAYQAMREMDGAFSFVRHEIFEVRDDIDIVFVGNSTLWAGIDSPIVEQALTEQLGRRARVLTFGSYWSGLDVPYMELRDALDRKRIGMVVLSIPRGGYNDGPSPVGYRFLEYGDAPEVTAALPLRYRVSLYAGYALRSPRDILAYFHGTRSVPSQYGRDNGSMLSDEGWRRQPFTRFTPPSPRLAAGLLTYSPATRNNFETTGEAILPYQEFYLRRIFELLQARHIKLVIASIPQYDERLRGKAVELQDWPAMLGPQLAMVGVPPVVLFQGLSEADIRKLYFDNVHFNRNGSEFFTRTITPALLELYANAAQHN